MYQLTLSRIMLSVSFLEILPEAKEVSNNV